MKIQNEDAKIQNEDAKNTCLHRIFVQGADPV